MGIGSTIYNKETNAFMGMCNILKVKRFEGENVTYITDRT
jgi:hypothetical protein